MVLDPTAEPPVCDKRLREQSHLLRWRRRCADVLQGVEQRCPACYDPEEKAKRKRDMWQRYDYRRSLIFMSFTICFGTPFWLVMYRRVDAYFPKKVTIPIALQKGMVTWCVANSTTPIFIAYLTVLEQCFVKGNPDWMQSIYTVPHKIFRDMPLMMQYSICFWSMHWIPMFYLLPPEFRLLYVSFLQIVWSGITSYILHRHH